MVKPDVLEQLLDTSRKMAENRLLDPLLEYAMTVALELFGAEYGYLVLLDKQSNLHFRVRQDKHGNMLEEPEEQISHTIFETVIQKQQPIITADAILDPEFQSAHSVQSLQLRSVMCVPMIARGDVLGAIYIENRSEKELFQDEDLVPLQYFAAQVAISIENAILNESLEGRVAERTAELTETNVRLEQEIAERKRAEEQIRKLSRAIEQSPTTVIITDTQACIEYVNPAFGTLTGYQTEEAIGKNPRILKSGLTPPETYVKLWDHLTNGKVWRGEFINKKKQGDIYWARAVVSPIRNVYGKTTHSVSVTEDISERKRFEEELQKLATIDSLTGTYNRHHFFTLAEKAFQQAQRYEQDLSALMIDLDHFKLINDKNGHAMGDVVLQTAARYFSKYVREADVLGRYGGEEFALIMPQTQLAEAREAACRLVQFIRETPIKTKKGPLQLTVSVGVASLQKDTKTIDQLVDEADQALYVAKQSGRDQVAIWDT